MLDVIARSQRGRVCEYRRGEASVRTPYVMKVTDGQCDDPMYISLEDGRRIMHVMGDRIELDDKLMSPESSDVIAEPVSVGNVTVLRLPFTGEEEIPEGTEIVVISNAFELRKDARKVVRAIIGIREKVGPNVLLCAPGMADPSTLALYSYMGID
ncbi:MAG: queuine tRNA-ribosyltransferase containing PUA domain protein, partial [Candidatus Methanomethylophilaceae archaeon]|nr:queuine tRNA-ribosyltransferase containing PUA domain protein [Candidatus Methanomethylophilaceae archaeon]